MQNFYNNIPIYGTEERVLLICFCKVVYRVPMIQVGSMIEKHISLLHVTSISIPDNEMRTSVDWWYCMIQVNKYSIQGFEFASNPKKNYYYQSLFVKKAMVKGEIY